MNENKPTYTPGPWWVEDSFTEAVSFVFTGQRDTPKEIKVADIWGENHVSDARLIAAAPDMFQALEELIAEHAGYTDSAGIQMAKAAIAKAKGNNEELFRDTTWPKSMTEHEKEFNAKNK